MIKALICFSLFVAFKMNHISIFKINIIMKHSQVLLLILFQFLEFASPQILRLTLSQFNCILMYQKIAGNSLYFGNCQSMSVQNGYFKKSTWQQCVNMCCGLTVNSYPYFNDQSISKCQQNNHEYQQIANVTLIVVSSLSTIAAIMILVALLQKIIQTCSGIKIKPQTQQVNQQYTIQVNKPIWLKPINQSNHTTFEVSEHEYPEQCPICLEKNSNLITSCMHSFHVNCLLAWFAKNMNCPLCKNTKIKEVRIQCRYCQDKYVLLPVNRAFKDVKQWLKFKNVCDTCRASAKVRARATTRDISFTKFNCSKGFDDIQAIQI